MAEPKNKQAADIIRRAARFVDSENFANITGADADVRNQALEERWAEFKSSQDELVATAEAAKVVELYDNFDCSS